MGSERDVFENERNKDGFLKGKLRYEKEAKKEFEGSLRIVYCFVVVEIAVEQDQSHEQNQNH